MNKDFRGPITGRGIGGTFGSKRGREEAGKGDLLLEGRGRGGGGRWGLGRDGGGGTGRTNCSKQKAPGLADLTGFAT